MTNAKHLNPIEIMGVLNANNDSFYHKSRFDKYCAQKNIEIMIEDGANIIDIGAVSSKPGSMGISCKEELDRIKDIIDLIAQQKLYEKIQFSLDSYSPLVIEYALNNGFSIINDITGLQNDAVAKLVGQYQAKIVIMHMQKMPDTMQESPVYEDVIAEVNDFFGQRIEKAKQFNIKEIILDVGIGFGKTLNHNLLLLKNLNQFKHFGYELLIGASRKSMIDMISPSLVEQRLSGTLAIHLESINKGASIIRCHDVKEHQQAISVQQAIHQAKIL